MKLTCRIMWSLRLDFELIAKAFVSRPHVDEFLESFSSLKYLLFIDQYILHENSAQLKIAMHVVVDRVI